MISTFYDLSVFFPVSLIDWEVFYRLIPCPVFFFSLPTIRLGGFSPVTWPFETHQVPYGARVFSVVSRFSSPVSLIGLIGFSPGFHSRFPFRVPFKVPLQQISCLTELISKERGNCNNVTLGAESSRSGSHMTTTNHNFNSSDLTSIMALGSSSSTPQSRWYVYLQAGRLFR